MCDSPSGECDGVCCSRLIADKRRGRSDRPGSPRNLIVPPGLQRARGSAPRLMPDSSTFGELTFPGHGAVHASHEHGGPTRRTHSSVHSGMRSPGAAGAGGLTAPPSRLSGQRQDTAGLPQRPAGRARRKALRSTDDVTQRSCACLLWAARVAISISIANLSKELALLESPAPGLPPASPLWGLVAAFCHRGTANRLLQHTAHPGTTCIRRFWRHPAGWLAQPRRSPAVATAQPLPPVAPARPALWDLSWDAHPSPVAALLACLAALPNPLFLVRPSPRGAHMTRVLPRPVSSLRGCNIPRTSRREPVTGRSRTGVVLTRSCASVRHLLAY